MANVIEILKEILKELKGNKQEEKITLSIEEAATISGIGIHKIRELVEKVDTDFPYFRVGCKTRIDKESMDRWLKKIAIEHRTL